MALPPLNVKIGADTSDLQSGLSGAQKRVAVFAAAAVAGLAAVGAGLVSLTKNSLANVDALSKQARSLGLSTKALQRMAMVAEEAGVETGQLSSMLGLMQRNIIELGQGTAAQTDAFARLGLSIQDLQGLSPDEQFERIAESLNNIVDPATKTATAMDIFGRSGRAAINMLDGYSAKVEEAAAFQEKFNITVSQVDADMIEKANDAFARLGMAMTGLGNVLAVKVAPAIIAISEGILKASEHLDVAAYSAGVLASGLTVAAIPAIYGMVTATGALTGALVILKGAIIKTGIGALVVAAGYLVAKFVDMAEEVGGFGRALGLLGGVAKAVFAGIGNVLGAWVDGFRAMGEDIKSIWQKMLKFLAQGFAALVSRIGEPLNKMTAVMGDALQIDTMSIEAWASSFDAAVINAENSAKGFRESEATKLAGAFDGVTAAVDAMNTAIADGPIGMTDGTALDPTGGLLPPTGASDVNRDDTDAPQAVPGLGGGAAITDQFAARLEALTAGLETERETLEAWRTQGLDDLARAREEGLLSEQEYLEQRKRLEEQYAATSNQIEKMRMENNRNQMVDGFGAILAAAGQGNKKLLKASQTFNAGMAFIDTMAGAARELRKGTFGIASAAAVIAQGIGFVNAIKSVNSGGGGLNAPSGGGASSAAPVQQAAAPTTTFSFTLQNDPMGFGESFARQMIDQLNEAQRNGGQIRGVLA